MTAPESARLDPLAPYRYLYPWVGALCGLEAVRELLDAENRSYYDAAHPQTEDTTMTTRNDYQTEYPAGPRRCDGCGALCPRAMVTQTREIRADSMTDVASFFDPAPRFAPAATLTTPGRLTWCCECHRMDSYCLPGEHELPAGAPRFEGRMITVPTGQRAPRCLAEMAGAVCEQAERGIAHGHSAEES